MYVCMYVCMYAYIYTGARNIRRKNLVMNILHK